MNCDLSEEPKLEFHRDLFIFQSCIGCRVSDLWAMTKQSVTKATIEYIAGKKINGDPQTLRVPLNSIAKAILEKYKDHKGPSLFPFGFQQDYNEDLKVIFKKAGVDRMQLMYDKGERSYEDTAVYGATIDDIDMDAVAEYAKMVGYGKSPLEYLRENKESW